MISHACRSSTTTLNTEGLSLRNTFHPGHKVTSLQRIKKGREAPLGVKGGRIR
ncbi:MAG: hypothetical protein ACD_25C00145G0001, partial [uncultured bacterium]